MAEPDRPGWRAMTESELDALLEIATGRGKWFWTGPYMHTYPAAHPSPDPIHSGCIELEGRGLLRRVVDEPNHVMWEAMQ